MPTKYEIDPSSHDYFTNTTTVPIVMRWPYGEPTPPILHSDQMLYLYSKRYIIIGFEYEPAFETDEEHTVTYTTKPYVDCKAPAPWEDDD